MHRIEMNVTTGKQINVPFTAAEEEEYARKVVEKSAKRAAEVERNGVLDAIIALETPTGFTRRQREFVLKNSSDVGAKSALATVDSDITKLRAKLKRHSSSPTP